MLNDVGTNLTSAQVSLLHICVMDDDVDEHPFPLRAVAVNVSGVQAVVFVEEGWY